jgi:hypothetical protein
MKAISEHEGWTTVTEGALIFKQENSIFPITYRAKQNSRLFDCILLVPDQSKHQIQGFLYRDPSKYQRYPHVHRLFKQVLRGQHEYSGDGSASRLQSRASSSL